jgi:hypothetical protein
MTGSNDDLIVTWFTPAAQAAKGANLDRTNIADKLALETDKRLGLTLASEKTGDERTCRIVAKNVAPKAPRRI